MTFHKVLARQLMRCGIKADELPTDKKKWQELIARINQTYCDTDQERYLLERSMVISSEEMNELNKKLETAQQIAGLGHWFYDRSIERITWSKELYKLYGLDPVQPVPQLENIYEIIHEEDRNFVKELVETAFKEGKGYEAEIRMARFDDKTDYHWFHVIGRAIIKEGEPIHQLAGIAMDISRRKRIEEEVTILNQKLLTSARRAGMADVATAILHNVGNILNSANVSINLIQEQMTDAYFKKLFAISDMLIENKNNLNEFLTNDERGKLIPMYLVELIKQMKQTHEMINQEVFDLREHINHIKDITATQKSLSGISGIVEKAFVPELINNAVNMCGKELKNKDIDLVIHFSDKFFIMTDKTKFLQILVNLIQNAREALLLSKNTESKKIEIQCKKTNNETVEIKVIDNGNGIAPENLTKIFSFGFTTKKDGHGFGLHSSALTAKELGGNMTVHSAGIERGAVFTLTLPVNGTVRRVDNESEIEPENYHH